MSTLPFLKFTPLFSVLTAIATVLSAAYSPDSFAASNNSYTLFESGQVRPLALSENGRMLFAANTPDNRLEVFAVKKSGLEHCGSVTVGLEPVAVAVRKSSEVWVVNHLSDSISIVKISTKACRHDSVPGQVVKTLLVGDEPRDIVFAGEENKRAFITTAHRGQNSPVDPQLTTPGIGRADVWVFDTEKTGKNLGGSPLNIISLFTDTPRALTVSADGKQVYVAGFYTGNRTTTVYEHNVRANGGLPGPETNIGGELQPATSLIVKHDGESWRDETGRSWDDHVKFNLPDKDVFVIDATANPPVEIAGSDYREVGTVIFNMVTNPVSGAVYVSNTDAANEVRFEGPGTFTGSSTRGRLHRSQISILKNGDVTPRHLNKHIDYSKCCAPLPNKENDRSLAFPVDMAISRNGTTLYVAAYGSSKVGVFDTRELENDSFTPDENDHIELSGGGPSGVVLDDKNNRLYVLTRFDNSVSVIDTSSRKEVKHISMYNPEPEHIVKGRDFLYNARLSSSHGDSACASCHVFGDMDALSWDLGNPDGTTMENTSPLVVHPAEVGYDVPVHFRPMKGPMTTQSLRGLANHGSQHWRGDRNGGHLGEPNQQPDSGVYNEAEAFRQFNPAYTGLLGRADQLTSEQMQAFTDFALELTYPPNPIRALDNSLNEKQQAGHDFFFGKRTAFGLSDPFTSCNGCHITDPAGNAEFAVSKPGFFGADGRATFELGPQIFKVPHLRNLYQKVGMFGMPKTPGGFINPESSDPDIDNAFMGDQIRGSGFIHDGSIDTIERFLNIIVFQHAESGPFPNPGGFALGEEGDEQRREVEQFILAFPSNMAPVVGQQVTVSRHNSRAAMARLDLLMSRADVGECDLIAKQSSKRREKGYVYQDGRFTPDSIKRSAVSARSLVRSSDHPVTFTCTTPGSGIRMGIDRDQDGILDGDA
ncbi:MAG: beta-propeller fold lactonase family protein [Gammaproteobacteria bacterium]|nr:beta-propeller fold lactonase family protein [Gammaproteobacteria bacterium]